MFESLLLKKEFLGCKLGTGTQLASMPSKGVLNGSGPNTLFFTQPNTLSPLSLSQIMIVQNTFGRRIHAQS